MYIAIAYRWGSSNRHQYVVAAGQDLVEITRAAREEWSDRGGKYGVAVYEMIGRAEHKGPLEYFPSMTDEVGQIRPERNWRLDALEDVGIKVAQHLDAPTGDQVPDWLARFARRAFDKADELQGIKEKQ